MPNNAGIDIVHHGGTIYLVDGNGKALLGFSPEAAEVLTVRLVNAIRESKGLQHVEATEVKGVLG